MADFKPIETQEQFDAAIGERLKRERDSIEAKYSDYDTLKTQLEGLEVEKQSLSEQLSQANTKISENESLMEGLNLKIKGYETDSAKTRIALEAGLPYSMVGRIQGDDEDSMKADAVILANMLKPQNYVPPLANSESSIDKKREAIKGLLQGLE